MVHSSSIFVVALTCFASSVQYANLLFIALLLQQPFVDDRWCATKFDNLTVVDSKDCALPGGKRGGVVGDFKGCLPYANN